MDKISVIIPVYNVEEYLRRCLDSVLKQTFENIEVVLVDDGSTDNSGNICDEYKQIDDRITVIHKLNGGLSDARNWGLDNCSGEYISFIDSDDWVSADFLAEMKHAMDVFEADICECIAVRTFGEEPAVDGIKTECLQFDKKSALKELIEDRQLHQHVWNKLYKRSCISSIQFLEGKTNEDEFWTYQVFAKADKIVKINQKLYYYYQRPGSIMNTTYSNKRLDSLDAKCQRQQFIEANFPELVSISKINLYKSCIYAGQMSIMHLKGSEKERAKSKIDSMRKAYKLSFNDLKHENKNSKLWLILSRFGFWNTVRLKNYMKKGF